MVHTVCVTKCGDFYHHNQYLCFAEYHYTFFKHKTELCVASDLKFHRRSCSMFVKVDHIIYTLCAKVSFLKS